MCRASHHQDIVFMNKGKQIIENTCYFYNQRLKFSSSAMKERHVFLTGASDYIGKHITLLLLQRGHTVTASLRNKVQQEAELRETIAKHLKDATVLKKNYPVSNWT